MSSYTLASIALIGRMHKDGEVSCGIHCRHTKFSTFDPELSSGKGCLLKSLYGKDSFITSTKYSE